jgi:hypothetical protein
VGAHLSVHGFLGNSFGEGTEALAADPEPVEEHGQLASYGDQGAALDSLAARGQSQSPLL